MPRRRNPANHEASKKASQNSPPAMAANHLDHFCRSMYVAKNPLRGESVFSPIYGRKSTGRSDSCFVKKA